MAFEHIGRGPKAQIDTAITDGKILAGDTVFTTDGNELVLIERDNSKVVVKSRTENEIEVLGVNLSSEVKDGAKIPAGVDLEDFIKLLVQKRIAASYTAPTISIANNGGQAATTVEAGTTVTVSVKSTFTKNDAGAITKHSITLAGVEVATGTDAVLTFSDSYAVPDGNFIAKSSVDYAEGAIKNDNFGDASPDGHIAAGTKTSSNYTIVGARKAFYGTAGAGSLPELTSDYIRTLANNKLAPKAGDKLNLTVAEGQQHIIVALPAGRTLSQVTYVDLGDKGMLSKFTQTTVNVDGASDSVEANANNVYTYSMASAAAAAMNFEFVVA